MRFSISLILFAAGVALLLLTSCSSSSQSQRYNKPAEEEGESQDNSVRFTSKDEVKKVDTLETRDVPGEFDIPPVEDNPVNTKEFVQKYDHIKTLSSALTEREKILIEIITYLETPYQYGGNTRNGIDCSAFTRTVFERAIGKTLPRTTSEQFVLGNEINGKNSLEFGDLIFFNTSSRSYPGHVGIYIGENMFAHASRSLGVTISSLESSYYANRYICGKRIN